MFPSFFTSVSEVTDAVHKQENFRFSRISGFRILCTVSRERRLCTVIFYVRDPAIRKRSKSSWLFQSFQLCFLLHFKGGTTQPSWARRRRDPSWDEILPRYFGALRLDAMRKPLRCCFQILYSHFQDIRIGLPSLKIRISPPFLNYQSDSKYWWRRRYWDFEALIWCVCSIFRWWLNIYVSNCS